KRRGRPAPPPGAERIQGPPSIVALSTLNLCDKRFALRSRQQVIQASRCQQQPGPIEETLRCVCLLQISAQPSYPRSRLICVALGGAGHNSDSQGRQRSTIIGAVNALKWLKPEIEPVPCSVGPLCLPQPLEGLLGGLARLSPTLCGVGARKDQSVEHRLSSTRLRL